MTFLKRLQKLYIYVAANVEFDGIRKKLSLMYSSTLATHLYLLSTNLLKKIFKKRDQNDSIENVFLGITIIANVKVTHNIVDPAKIARKVFMHLPHFADLSVFDYPKAIVNYSS